MDNEMPCFNPENVIFITNKWDSLNTNNTDEDSSDDDEESKVWENIKSNVKQRWPSVREENIFKMNLKDVIFDILYYKSYNILKLSIFNESMVACLLDKMLGIFELIFSVNKIVLLLYFKSAISLCRLFMDITDGIRFILSSVNNLLTVLIISLPENFAKYFLYEINS